MTMRDGAFPDEDELQRLERATADTLGPSAFYAFKDTPAAKEAMYLLTRWREIARTAIMLARLGVRPSLALAKLDGASGPPNRQDDK